MSLWHKFAILFLHIFVLACCRELGTTLCMIVSWCTRDRVSVRWFGTVAAEQIAHIYLQNNSNEKRHRKWVHLRAQLHPDPELRRTHTVSLSHMWDDLLAAREQTDAKWLWLRICSMHEMNLMMRIWEMQRCHIKPGRRCKRSIQFSVRGRHRDEWCMEVAYFAFMSNEHSLCILHHSRADGDSGRWMGHNEIRNNFPESKQCHTDTAHAAREYIKNFGSWGETRRRSWRAYTHDRMQNIFRQKFKYDLAVAVLTNDSVWVCDTLFAMRCTYEKRNKEICSLVDSVYTASRRSKRIHCHRIHKFTKWKWMSVARKQRRKNYSEINFDGKTSGDDDDGKNYF